MLFYVFASVMCSFRAFLSREECQTLRIDLCRHADDLSTISSLFGDCEAYGVWPTKSFHPMLLWPSSVFHACFSRARCLSLYLIWCTASLEAPFPIWSSGFLSMLEIERIGLWAISMFKPRRTFVTLPENP